MARDENPYGKLSGKTAEISNKLDKQQAWTVSLQKGNSRLKKDINKLSLKLDAIQKDMSNNIEKKHKELKLKIKSSEKNVHNEISEVKESIDKASLFGVIRILFATAIPIVLYFLLIIRQKADKTNVINQLTNTKKAIEESFVREFTQQMGSMSTQMKVMDPRKTNDIQTGTEPNHSLTLKLANEINTMERNIAYMDTGIKGLKQLLSSVSRLKDNLSANGYEVPELLGKSFNLGMRVTVVNSIPDENLGKGEEIITRVVKPQVDYNGKVIQFAEIEVSVGI